MERRLIQKATQRVEVNGELQDQVAMAEFQLLEGSKDVGRVTITTNSLGLSLYAKKIDIPEMERRLDEFLKDLKL